MLGERGHVVRPSRTGPAIELDAVLSVDGDAALTRCRVEWTQNVAANADGLGEASSQVVPAQ